MKKTATAGTWSRGLALVHHERVQGGKRGCGQACQRDNCTPSSFCILVYLCHRCYRRKGGGYFKLGFSTVQMCLDRLPSLRVTTDSAVVEILRTDIDEEYELW